MGDAMISLDGITWTPTGSQLAFEVYEADPQGMAIPEPATLTILALGVLGLVTGKRIQR